MEIGLLLSPSSRIATEHFEARGEGLETGTTIAYVPITAVLVVNQQTCTSISMVETMIQPEARPYLHCRQAQKASSWDLGSKVLGTLRLLVSSQHGWERCDVSQ